LALGPFVLLAALNPILFVAWQPGPGFFQLAALLPLASMQCAANPTSTIIPPTLSITTPGA
jgi:hypothetical protein